MSVYHKRMWMIQELASRKDTGEIVVIDTIMTFCEPEDPDQVEADYAKMEADLAELREENRKLRDAWPRYAGKCVYKWGQTWVVHGTPGLHPTRDEAISFAAGITRAAEAAKGE